MKKLLPTATNPCHFLVSAFLLLPFITAFRPVDDPDDQYATCYVIFAGASTSFICSRSGKIALHIAPKPFTAVLIPR